MRYVDRTFGVLLILAGIAHAFGSLAAYPSGSSELVWALAATVLVILLGWINLMRSARANDRTLAWTCFAGLVVWIAFALAFGASVGSVADYRVVIHVAIALVLAGFSLTNALTGNNGRAGV